MNQNYIAQNLCENRTKPLVLCKGKCTLVKKLKQSEEKARKQTANAGKEHSEIVYYIAPNLFFEYKTTFIPPCPLKEALNVHYLEPLGRLIISAVFHPPSPQTV